MVEWGEFPLVDEIVAELGLVGEVLIWLVSNEELLIERCGGGPLEVGELPPDDEIVEVIPIVTEVELADTGTLVDLYDVDRLPLWDWVEEELADKWEASDMLEVTWFVERWEIPLDGEFELELEIVDVPVEKADAVLLIAEDEFVFWYDVDELTNDESLLESVVIDDDKTVDTAVLELVEELLGMTGVELDFELLVTAEDIELDWWMDGEELNDKEVGLEVLIEVVMLTVDSTVMVVTMSEVEELLLSMDGTVELTGVVMDASEELGDAYDEELLLLRTGWFELTVSIIEVDAK